MVVVRWADRDGVGLVAPAAARRHPGMPFKRKGRVLTPFPGKGGKGGVRGQRFPLRRGRSPLRGWAVFPVRGFDFPCTRVWVSLYEGLVPASRALRVES